MKSSILSRFHSRDALHDNWLGWGFWQLRAGFPYVWHLQSIRDKSVNPLLTGAKRVQFHRVLEGTFRNFTKLFHQYTHTRNVFIFNFYFHFSHFLQLLLAFPRLVWVIFECVMRVLSSSTSFFHYPENNIQDNITVGVSTPRVRESHTQTNHWLKISLQPKIPKSPKKHL